MYYTKEEFEVLKKDYNHMIDSIKSLLLKEEVKSYMVIKSPKILSGTIKAFAGSVGILAFGGAHLIATKIIPYNLDLLSGKTLSGLAYMTYPTEMAIGGLAGTEIYKSIADRLSFKEKERRLDLKAQIEEEKLNALKEGSYYFDSLRVPDDGRLTQNMQYLYQLLCNSRKDILYSLLSNEEECKEFKQEFYNKQLWYNINSILINGTEKMVQDVITIQGERQNTNRR